jgi:hypothetical protein
LRRKAAPGVDGVTWREYETGIEGLAGVPKAARENKEMKVG